MLSASLVERKVLTKEITMAKKVYSKPMLKSEAFVPQSYVAACGDSGTDYYFTCDAGGGRSGEVWLETNGKPGLQTGRGGDQSLGGYHACKEKHTASSLDDFPLGYYRAYWSSTVINVRVWTEGGKDVHCTENLDMKTWETAKS